MGGSPYLYEHLVTQHKPSGIIVLQSGGMKPCVMFFLVVWIKNADFSCNRRTAICRGAVFKGFLQLMEDGTSNPEQASTAPITVTSTISRASFGTVYNVRLDKEKHHREDKVWDELQGIWKARNQMQWFLKRVSSVTSPTTRLTSRAGRKRFQEGSRARTILSNSEKRPQRLIRRDDEPMRGRNPPKQTHL